MKTILLVVLFILGGCATTYQSSGITGGFSEQHMEDDIWRVAFDGNGYTTRETAQTYWLYRCAELSLEQGYDGFEILSQIELTFAIPPEKFFDTQGGNTKTNMVYVPMYLDSSKPSIMADIRLLKSPIKPQPPTVFDAQQLKALLESFVAGEKCASGNICPHVHKYLHPADKFEQQGV